MNITIEIVHKYIIKVHKNLLRYVIIILVCKWHLFFRILRNVKMVKILTFINQERQRVQQEYKMNFSGNVSSKWKISSKCHKSITMPRMNGLLYEVSNKGFCHKRCFRKSRGTTYFACRAMNLRKVQFCWTCCLFRYVTDRRLFVRKKEKRSIQFMTNKCSASGKLNWSEKFNFDHQTRQL